MSGTSKETLKISAKGIVQGVGFRPFVYQLAGKYKLNGMVRNTSEDVLIEIAGSKSNLDNFLDDLKKLPPPMSVIESIEITRHPFREFTAFKILDSVKEENKYQLISPDIATCPRCRSEIFDPEDRRYRYPFTNCTNCGPRFTIIEDIPYDRALTTMRKFMMCPKCHQEYEDPLNRRFHAQPNACPECGPVLTMVNTEGKRIATNDVVKAAAKYLKEGKIIAIKGLGGFLLACDARSDIAVNELRIRKQRPHKPLAIMVKDIAEALKYCKISAAEKSLLQSPQAPIVLLQRKTKSAVSGYVAPNNRYLGVMLPYTPLHHILLTESGIPLVMTSGNRSEEPIVGKNEEALQRLAGIADFFLMHNRDIHSTYDDSVTRIEDKKVETIRRARGFAPYPVRLPFTVKQILACGAEEKNTFCLTRDSYAFISQHIGDMENLDTLEHFDNTISLYRRLFRIEPEIIACDMHPEYLSTRFALEQAARLSSRPLAIQHHHAHIASCMAENKHESPVIGVALDGTGYGTDETIWGGEFLVADFATFERIGQLEYLPLPGGAAAIMQPYRTAIGYLQVLMGDAVFSSGLEFLKKIGSEEINFIRQQVYSNFNAPPTSSMGRLFDAVSALIGIRDTITFEAQAAIDLEMAAYSATGAEDCSYPFAIVKRQGVSQIKIKGILEGVVNDLLKNVPTAEISLKFHTTVANIIVEMCRLIREKTLLKTVALSGGVFQNRLLLKMAKKLLKSSGFAVLSHRQVPCNDGGISLGQAAIAGYIKR